MLLQFTIPFRTDWGQRLVVCGNLPELGSWQAGQALPLHYQPDTGIWTSTLTLPDTELNLEYKYLLLDERDGGTHWEWGANRQEVVAEGQFQQVILEDFWRAPAQPENELHTAAFTRALMRRPGGAGQQPRSTARVAHSVVRFQLPAPRVDTNHQLCVLGSDAALGNWEERKAVVLSDRDYPTWCVDVALEDAARPVYYKYGIWDAAARKIIHLEEGDNRVLLPGAHKHTLRVRHDEHFRYPTGPWRGAGVALPVFALRSRSGLGVGEFTDIQLLVDWAKLTGLKMVQILPINDTTATHTWVDSYPYAAISVFALHPMYLSLDAIAPLADAAHQQELQQLREELNQRDFVDYEPVMQAKWKFARLLYQQEKAAFLASPDFRQFLAEQQSWLVPYAAFSAWRDRFGTADFEQWPAEFRTPPTYEQIINFDSPEFDEYGLHLFTQFHLDQQLRTAVEYARYHGVVLKGDLPIGIYRHSVDAWTQPELYHMDRQAGAPPDDFSVTGQNWRFPTYNWQRMAEDGYAWWRQRLTHLSRYFDALRIDHILGFFRIWEIQGDSVEGLLGRFAPALPLHRDEVRARLGWFDYPRLCEPYIRWHMLRDIFGGEADAVRQEFLEESGYEAFRFQDHVRTQRQIEAVFEEKLRTRPEQAEALRRVRDGLYRLVNEVLFLEEHGTYGQYLHPRIKLQHTYSFRELDEETRHRLWDVYLDFFYRRHEDFWRRQGLVKLPAVRYATDMLICGEDLGMVPESVPGVMKALGILGLNIQRMPADPKTEFGHPDSAPYLSVVSPGSHDMSTVRGWWEEDRAKTQRFFEQVLGHWGEQAPHFCEPWVAQELLVQHLYSPAMWAVFPIQDLLAIDADLRRENPQEEQINVPANPQHFWKYRLHLPLEQLLEASVFNAHLHHMMVASGREQVY
ncbi:4-alpha-glucanotransferase [Hymenobacter lutimineralis]|uniref:4-alpha-glucanotransferase n=1 Tax=Hymenobacter lutimineralis TaxID=2606448 RepID=A0A5D6VDU3_9BACT|nr:4-alpha-glucanotransferase [Hymenobacter lutimineralis]TYZ13560.1 4-alpha-glucanotransferase [Hymenobacter lutimineralis]